MSKSIIAIFASAATLAGCASIGGPGVSSYYDCGGRMLKVDYLDDDAVQVQVNQENPIVLPRMESASGAKFGDARHSFWDKGSEATWTVGRMAPIQCRKVTVPR